MAITIAWNNIVPADTDDPRQGATDIRAFKQALNERFAQGGLYFEDPSGTDAEAGRICTGIQAANVLSFYGDDRSTVILTADDSTDTWTLGTGWSLVADKTNFSKGVYTEQGYAATAVAISSSATWPAVPSGITVSNETTPQVFVSGWFVASNGSATDEYFTQAIIQMEINGSGTWRDIASYKNGAIPLFMPVLSDGATASGDWSASVIVNTVYPTPEPIAAGDVLTFRWYWEAAANAAALNIGASIINAYEITQ